jgi:uncharacterized protein YndB with AHSA1/START domain
MHMPQNVIKRQIEIHAPVAKVWSVFTNPEVTRQMGGEYVSDWQVGSSLQFKGMEGQILTNGVILKFETEKVIQHRLFNSVGSAESIITYEFEAQDDMTILHSREEFAEPIADNIYSDALEGWDAALRTVKDIAERI